MEEETHETHEKVQRRMGRRRHVTPARLGRKGRAEMSGPLRGMLTYSCTLLRQLVMLRTTPRAP